jgi:hypothetical protein
MTATWWCEAYGPPQEGVPADRWPRCFLSPDVGERRCASAEVCTDVMASERSRVFSRINELAVDGGVYRYLADEIPTPGSILGGPDADGGR